AYPSTGGHESGQFPLQALDGLLEHAEGFPGFRQVPSPPLDLQPRRRIESRGATEVGYRSLEGMRGAMQGYRIPWGDCLVDCSQQRREVPEEYGHDFLQHVLVATQSGQDPGPVERLFRRRLGMEIFSFRGHCRDQPPDGFEELLRVNGFGHVVVEATLQAALA